MVLFSDGAIVMVILGLTRSLCSSNRQFIDPEVSTTKPNLGNLMVNPTETHHRGDTSLHVDANVIPITLFC